MGSFEEYANFKEVLYLLNHGLYDDSDVDVAMVPGYEVFLRINEGISAEASRLIMERNVDLVHVHDYQLAAVHKFIPESVLKVFSLHSPLPRGEGRYIDWFLELLRGFDAIAFSSPSYIEQARCLGLEGPVLLSLPPITDTNMFTPDMGGRQFARDALGICDKVCVITCVQRFDSKSGQRQLIEAVARVASEIPDVVVFLVGGRSMTDRLSGVRTHYLEQIQQLVEESGLINRVRFLGAVRYEDLPGLYRASDIVAALSRRECFGLCVTEAMACAVPIIGTEVGGIALQVRNGIDGLLVPVDSVADTAAAIVALVSNDELRKCMGLNARARVDGCFATENLVEEHVDRYYELIGSQSCISGGWGGQSV